MIQKIEKLSWNQGDKVTDALIKVGVKVNEIIECQEEITQLLNSLTEKKEGVSLRDASHPVLERTDKPIIGSGGDSTKDSGYGFNKSSGQEEKSESWTEINKFSDTYQEELKKDGMDIALKLLLSTTAEKARQEERERCLKIVENMPGGTIHEFEEGKLIIARDLKSAITKN